MSTTGLGITRPKARKEHPCGWCVEPITPTEQYVRVTFAQDGSAYSYCQHEDCFDAEGRAQAYTRPMHEEPVCCNTDIDGGSHERGKNCPDCSDIPITAPEPRP